MKLSNVSNYQILDEMLKGYVVVPKFLAENFEALNFYPLEGYSTEEVIQNSGNSVLTRIYDPLDFGDSELYQISIKRQQHLGLISYVAEWRKAPAAALENMETGFVLPLSTIQVIFETIHREWEGFFTKSS